MADHQVDMKAAALDCAIKGHRVFPCGINKKPLTKNGFKDATTDTDTIDEWWTQYPGASIGAPSGDGIFILDVDLPDGPAALEKLEQENDPLPATLEQKTGSGGRHLFFSVDAEVRNSAGKLGQNLDIRGDGGYIILPPSPHESGNCYEWTNKNQIAKAPNWFIDKLTVQRPKEKEQTPTTVRRQYGQKSLAAELAELTGTGEGSRNHRLNQAAFSLGQLVSGGELDNGQVEAALRSAAVSIGLSSKEAELTIHSGLEAGRKEPRTAPDSSVTNIPTVNTDATIGETLQQTVERLAKLPPLEYDQIREDEAKKLNARVGTLDKEVSTLRKAVHKDSDDRMFPDDEPYCESVNGEQLLNGLVAVFASHSVLPKGSDIALALWTILTYCFDLFRTLPILAITSPEKRCGKTTTLETLTKLCCRAMPASNISPAAMFRSIEVFTPCLLVDEADTFIKSNDDLRGIINSGHTKAAAYVIRCDGEKNEPKRFSTWCPKVIAMIGTPPGTILDRSVVVPLRRKLEGETVKRLDETDENVYQELREKIIRFVSDNQYRLKTTRPERLETSNDRSADNWNPLLAIAAIAGEASEIKARSAAKSLVGSDIEDEPPSTQLLADIRDILKTLPSKNISSESLVRELTGLDDRPWCEWKRGKPMTKNSLARLLKPFSIKSKTIRTLNTTAKGYEISDFTDAFARYLPSQNVTTSQANNISKLNQQQNVAQHYDVTLSKQSNKPESQDCYGVTVQDEITEGESLGQRVIHLSEEDLLDGSGRLFDNVS